MSYCHRISPRYRKWSLSPGQRPVLSRTLQYGINSAQESQYYTSVLQSRWRNVVSRLLHQNFISLIWITRVEYSLKANRIWVNKWENFSTCISDDVIQNNQSFKLWLKLFSNILRQRVRFKFPKPIFSLLVTFNKQLKGTNL